MGSCLVSIALLVGQAGPAAPREGPPGGPTEFATNSRERKPAAPATSTIEILMPAIPPLRKPASTGREPVRPPRAKQTVATSQNSGTSRPSAGPARQTGILAQAQPQPAPPPIEIFAPILPPVAIAAEETKTAEADVTPAERWWFMRELQGTWIGAVADNNRLYMTGWIDQSYTAATTNVTTEPVVWNDRSNRYLLQQGWFRLERSIVTNTNKPTWGFRVDVLTGSDYRFTLPRGLFNAQLLNSTGAQNLYGVDPIQHYVNVYLPNVFKGVELRFGRLYTPWGVESLEAVSSPLPTRSYAFNWSPPFTHCGLGAYVTFNDRWSGVFMLVNGNDVYFGDPSEELRTVGTLTWTNQRKDTVTVAWGLGRGRFNNGDPFNPATVSLMSEAAGRNNFNSADVVWLHAFNPKLTYALESIISWQNNAPDAFSNNPNGLGMATWAAAAHYLFYTVTPKFLTILRYENFEDSVGQRTGFAGLYTAVTVGARYNLRPGVIFRPELRYDYQSNARPFEGKHDIFVATADMIVRW